MYFRSDQFLKCITSIIHSGYMYINNLEVAMCNDEI